MSPEAVRARTEIYGSPCSGGAVDSSAIRMSPETESRSSQVAKLSATAIVKEPEAERRSTDPLVELMPMSPDPELACRLPPSSDWPTTSPEPDFALAGQAALPAQPPPGA